MNKVSVNQLIGKALDYAVLTQCLADNSGFDLLESLETSTDGSENSPSTNWADGGPIISESGLDMRIHHFQNPNKNFVGGTQSMVSFNDSMGNHGPAMKDADLLIATMRAYVAFYNRDGVLIPDCYLVGSTPDQNSQRTFTVVGGIATLENGETVDLMNIHTVLEQAYRDSGSDHVLEQIKMICKLSGKPTGSNGDFYDL